MTRAAEDALVVRDARRFMATAAAQLQRLLGPAIALRRRLQHTAEYRLALKLSRADRERERDALPAYILAGTLESMFVEEVEHMIGYLQRAARARPRRGAGDGAATVTPRAKRRPRPRVKGPRGHVSSSTMQA